MSWSLVMAPLRQMVADGQLDWLSGLDGFAGLPASEHVGPLPDGSRPPSVEHVLSAVSATGCHGVPWFSVTGRDVTKDIRSCPDPAACTPAGGRDLGEVTIRTVRTSADEPLLPSDVVTSVSFRKPHSAAVLAVAVVLADRAGPMIVLDDGATAAVVVRPGDDPAALARRCPW